MGSIYFGENRCSFYGIPWVLFTMAPLILMTNIWMQLIRHISFRTTLSSNSLGLGFTEMVVGSNYSTPILALHASRHTYAHRYMVVCQWRFRLRVPATCEGSKPRRIASQKSCLAILHICPEVSGSFCQQFINYQKLPHCCPLWVYERKYICMQ